MASQIADRRLARRARVVAMVLIATIVLWLAIQLVGGTLGLPPRYVFLADFAALAAFVWALAVTLQIWRRRRAGATEKG